MSSHPPSRPEHAAIRAAASAWLARRDRGLTPAEQDAYLEWLRENPLHAEAMQRLDRAWMRLDGLVEWRPEHSFQPNPDLLARQEAPRRKRWWLAGISAALAAAAAVAVWVRAPETPAAGTETGMVRLVRHSALQSLPDGSVAELNAASNIAIEFSPTLRRVRLERGEAHFTVAKDPARPFIVSVGDVAVRAVGTVFNVRTAPTGVDVLVTEGRVEVTPSVAAISTPKTGAPVPASPALVTAGQRAVVGYQSQASPTLTVERVSPADIERALVWQGERLEFAGITLAAVAEEFNCRNRHQLIVTPEAAAIRVGGNFRSTQIEAFVRLLEASFGIEADRSQPDRTVLARMH
ncbi:MAG: FecR domain-containing protein [Opitutae bacterium]|nr:FecR domain-containing protein [Opitutae bacterium]